VPSHEAPTTPRNPSPRISVKGPDRIRSIDDENTLAASIAFCDLEKIGLVTIDNDDGMLVTINSFGRAALAQSVEKKL